MSWNELLKIVGQDWILFGITFILLFMFLRRAFRVGGFLGITGIVASCILLTMLTWVQWNKYQVGKAIIQIVHDENPTFQVLTPEQEPIFKPTVVTVNNVRYVIDADSKDPKHYLPWRIIAIPK